MTEDRRTWIKCGWAEKDAEYCDERNCSSKDGRTQYAEEKRRKTISVNWRVHE